MGEYDLETLLGFLDRLEAKESGSLAWGVTDTRFTGTELDKMIGSYLQEVNLDSSEAYSFRESLISRGLIVALEYPDGLVYRSRMAETVRLLASQRQLFESHLEDSRWQGAPRLVADYRLLVRPRRYPVRDVSPVSLVSDLRDLGVDDGVRRALEALLNRSGTADDFELSAFQARSTTTILGALGGNRSTGVVVTAGTGSGKTLAFYLPVLSFLVGFINSSAWVKAVAIYPRNELLKDQFTETYREARRLDARLAEDGRRPMRIGAFFGPTPEYPAQVGRFNAWGPMSGGGFVCPFMRCPTCDGNLLWLRRDIEEGRERLSCQSADCGHEILEGEVALTRQGMAKVPPDLVFTTTEMLNQRFTDTRYRHLFGLGHRAPLKPVVVLLDEVHTYEDVHGAQVALLLRRWQKSLARPLTFVGLSATLRDPQSFFSDLVGVREDLVTVVQPEDHELVSDGMEYVLALRGDPNPQTSLLSTTIQTAIALGRSLEPTHSQRAPVYGKRIFLFTDDLDVTNRLYDNLRDAEGIDAFGRRIQRPDRSQGALGNLRSPALPDRSSRLLDGQSWDMMEAIGYSLRPPEHLQVTRTSSQDAGVDSRSDIVVATAKLDVGYNDPVVGGVIQHKSPRAPSQFIQRRGRAGRLRVMRPWTAVVLSDYGRDRLNYQNYERLFDPQLDIRRLPIRNRYVLRIQAVYALMDWLGIQVTDPEGYIWEDLRGPSHLMNDRSQPRVRARQEKILVEVERLLVDSDRRSDLAEYVADSLGIDPDDVASILWEPPRGLFEEVLPTIRRRLSTQWQGTNGASRTASLSPGPLPDFVPRALFSELVLPEVAIVTPSTGSTPGDPETLPVAQAIREFMPGRVTRRYGSAHGLLRHWVRPGGLLESAESNLVDLESWVVSGGEVGRLDASGVRLEVVRPWTLSVEEPPRAIHDSSNARPIWQSRLRPASAGLTLDPPHPSDWEDRIESMSLYSHNRSSAVEVMRAAVASRASVRLRDGSVLERDLRFRWMSKPAALGFEIEVDGLSVKLNPGELWSLDYSDPELRSLRSARFVHEVTHDPFLMEVGGAFAPERLAHIYFSALVETSYTEAVAIPEALELLGQHQERLVGALDRAFTQPDLESAATGQHRLHDQLAGLLSNQAVVDALRTHAEEMVRRPSPSWEAWLRGRFASTVGTAFMDACLRMLPNVATDDLTLDVDHDEDGGVSFWITESSIGGSGVIEEFASEFAADPRRFFQLVDASLKPSDFEEVDRDLIKVLDLLQSGDAELIGIVQRFRDARNPDSSRRVLRELVETLNQRGLSTSHTFVSALSTRLLRPGSDENSDHLVHALVTEWREIEDRLGVEIDFNVASHLLAQSRGVLDAMARLPIFSSGPRWKLSTIQSLLWPRGWQLRASSLFSFNPYQQLPATDRLLVERALDRRTRVVDLADPGWRPTLNKALQDHSTVLAIDSDSDAKRLNQRLAEILCQPIEVGFLHAYPRVVGVERAPNLGVVLEIEETPQ